MEEIELLKLENISYKSQKYESLLNVSFSVRKGESVVIFGPEDSGIINLCPIIAGLTQGYEGNILYKGKSIKSLNYLETHRYRQDLGYLQRDYGLISNMSVLENISLPLKYHSNLSTIEIEELVDNHIKEMNLTDCRNKRPVYLKRSERLKTAFLRSIILSPEMLLLEHPIDGQCLFNIQIFFQALKKILLTKAMSAIFITYYPKLFIDLADKFIMLHKGHIVFTGSRADFSLTDNRYLHQYFNLLPDGPMAEL
ncbi:MAG: ATP-binding cassette domain-containing protein [Spirochaetes bacterium]|nr:ATP-binding cassette domain-containing protein [Spirochaetota bacterium]